MTYPRSHLVDLHSPGAYHCTSRCVRRAFLCGFDELTGQSFEHRRQWLEDRVHLQTACFAISAYAYAVMSNHVHLVLQVDPGLAAQWSDDEVVARWRRIYPVKSKPGRAGGAVETISPQRIGTWRERLGSLSWFMRALNEPIARAANREDDCTGKFWEGRFSSQALLDDRAFLAAMAYADLNPVRAGIADSLATSEHTGVALRLAQFRARNSSNCLIAAQECPAAEHAAGKNPDSAALPSREREPRIKPIAGAIGRFGPDVSESQYLELVAWSARQHISDSGAVIEPESFKQLGCTASEWQKQLDAIRFGWRVVGGSEQVRRLAERINQRWFNRNRRRKRKGVHGRHPPGNPLRAPAAGS